MSPRKLHQLSSGDRAVVIENSCVTAHASRLAELGLTAGESVQILQGGSPMLLQVGESRFCLRSDDAAEVAVLCVQ